MTGWLLSATSLTVCLCVSELVCAEEHSCFACSNVLSWVTPRPGGPVFQIISCGYSAILQQKHILADLGWFVEHHLLGLKCVFDVLSGNEVHIFLLGVSWFLFIINWADPDRSLLCSSKYRSLFLYNWGNHSCVACLGKEFSHEIACSFLFFCRSLPHHLVTYLPVSLSVILCQFYKHTQIRALSGDAFLPTETKHWNALLINSVDRVRCAF